MADTTQDQLETPQGAPVAEQKASSKDKKVADTATTVHVKIYSPFQIYFNDEAESISAENATGPFDILPRHHNFITLLTPCDVVIKSQAAGDKTIRINRAVMHIRRNKVTVFLDV